MDDNDYFLTQDDFNFDPSNLSYQPVSSDNFSFPDNLSFLSKSTIRNDTSVTKASSKKLSDAEVFEVYRDEKTLARDLSTVVENKFRVDNKMNEKAVGWTSTNRPHISLEVAEEIKRKVEAEKQRQKESAILSSFPAVER